jgi:hypothetical protein
MSENYVMLQTVNVGSNQPANITFTNIPSSGYTDLVIKGSTRDTGVNGAIVWTFNGDGTNGNYVAKRVQTQGTSAYSDTITRYVAQNGTNETANTFTSWEMYIPNYAAATNHTFLIDSVVENNGSTLNNESSSLTAAYWTGGASINSIGLTTNAAWATSSVVTLYGISAIGSNPSIGPKAIGGDIIKTDGTYWYHAFRSSGTFTPLLNLTCDYLVVAGGGSGGFLAGGGGGAGGLRSTLTATGGGGSLESPLSLISETAYTVTIGSGGTGTTSSRSNGSNSVFSTITSTGGGAGGNRSTSNVTGNSGGSGGGGGSLTGGTPNSQVGGSGTANQGYGGGSAITNNSTYVSGGGGGGAGAVGTNASAGVTGNGGAGVSISSFASVTGTGVSNYYAGGGGGGYYASSLGTGGAGGGGNSDVNGTANTGGGGGGAVTDRGMNGGSGIVIIRYAMA